MREGLRLALFALSHLSFQIPDDRIVNHFHQLRAFALRHPEARFILSAIDWPESRCDSAWTRLLASRPSFLALKAAYPETESSRYLGIKVPDSVDPSAAAEHVRAFLHKENRKERSAALFHVDREVEAIPDRALARLHAFRITQLKVEESKRVSAELPAHALGDYISGCDASYEWCSD